MIKKYGIVSIFVAILIVLALATGVSAGINRVDRPALKDVYKDYFYIGTIYYSTRDVSSTNYITGLYPEREMDGITQGTRTDAGLKLKHFNAFTNANFMKPDSLWTNTNGSPNWNQGNGNVDDSVRLAKELGNFMQGHTLLWHNQSPNWPISDNSWDYATARTMMEHYLRTVLTHFNNPDPLLKFDAIDVINEPMKNNPSNPTDWRNALRTGYNPEERTARWARAYAKGGNSWDYVYDAFIFARRYTDFQLTYNDFNDLENDNMSTAVVSMVNEFNEKYRNSNERKLFDKDGKQRNLVDIVGTQSHYDMRLNLDAFERNIRKYLDADVKVDLTEVDVSLTRTVNKNRTSGTGANMGFITNRDELIELAKEQGIFYAKMFAMLRDVDKYKKGINRVTMWGVNDNDWRASGYPLPWYNTASANAFGRLVNEPKEAYWALVQPEAYLEEVGLSPNGVHATFTYNGKSYPSRTWGGANCYAEVKIDVPESTQTINFTAANVTLPADFTITSITMSPPSGDISGGKPCVVTVQAVGTNPTAMDPTDPAVPLTTVKNTATYKLTFAWGADSTRKNGAWRLAKKIESGKTYIVVSTETVSVDPVTGVTTGYALTNKNKPAVANVGPQSLSRMPVIVSGDILKFRKDSGDAEIEQENIKWIFTDRTSVPPGKYTPPAKYAANQIGYTLQCLVHATRAYPQMMFRDTSLSVADQYELVTRMQDGSESPGVADKALDQAIWFNTGIDQVTGATKMFLYTASEDQHYVLKEVLTGATNMTDLGSNNTAVIIPTIGGFVAMKANGPEDATEVKLYEYTIEPYVDIPATGVSLDKYSTTILLGNNEQLTAAMIPSDASYQQFTWKSDNPSVATVSQTGFVESAGLGSTNITVTTVDGFEAKCYVTVAMPASGITISPAALSLDAGETYFLMATITPENVGNANLVWTSSNESVVTVTQGGIIRAVGSGATVTITATAADGSGVFGTCIVEVPLYLTSGVELNKTYMMMLLGQTETLIATVLPTYATSKDVIWSCDSPYVATVDQNGLVTAIGTGPATITVKTVDGGFEATCVINVIQPVTGITISPATLLMNVGQTHWLTSTVEPYNAANTSLAWSSSNTAVATVNAAGIVNGLAGGTVTITATATDGSLVTASCLVTVTDMMPAAPVLPSGLVSIDATEPLITIPGSTTEAAAAIDMLSTLMPGIKSADLHVDKYGQVTVQDYIVKDIVEDIYGLITDNILTLPVFEANVSANGNTAAIAFDLKGIDLMAD
ncbi:MAG: Ig-like domain-containing protein, partial [Synergistaceae bacterium]|nr:Ig-like domain-containing protein [Synergistaceae bacterium]